MTAGERPAVPRHARQLQLPLRPPGAATAKPATGPASRWGLWLVLGLLMLLGGGVVLVLPGLLDNNKASPLEPASQAPPLAVESSPADPKVQLQAEQTLQRFLRLQAELKLVRAPDWAGAEWESAAQHAARGDRFFGERRFSEAGQSYAQAVAGLEAVKAGRPARLVETLAAAGKALADDDTDSAQRNFELALLIDTDNEEARTGLARARVRAPVLQFMTTAAQAEALQQLEAAQAAYQQALRLDAAYAPALQGLAKIEAALGAQRFDTAMSEALAALASKRFDAAAAALDKAAAIDPRAVALTDTRERLRLARRQAAINALRRDADARVRAEDWQGTVELYRRVLQIDAAAGFARNGIAHAQLRAELNRQFDHYLDEPTRLYSAEPLANAEQLLQAAAGAPADEPKLRSKLERLRVLVSQARQPLPVMLQSDGVTEVVIYHVGRLGRFVDRQLELPPGSYTAVGSRPGYRDVRRVFELQPGHSSLTVDIRCEEPV